MPLEWDQSGSGFPRALFLLPQIPTLMSQSTRCVLRIKVSVVGIRNKGLKRTTCKQSLHLEEDGSTTCLSNLFPSDLFS